VDEWRRFPLADPGLPRELLPPDWIGARAAAMFGGRHRDWEAPARARWAELGAAGAGAAVRSGRRSSQAAGR
jgi:phenylacetic acid degradation operon negative regulatory protein